MTMSLASGANDPKKTTHNRQQKEASMERALRTLNLGSSPTPQPSNKWRSRQLSSTKEKRGIKCATKAIDGELSEPSEESVKVAVRLRPLATLRSPEQNNRVWKTSTEKNTINEIHNVTNEQISSLQRSARRSSGEANYVFDRVFAEESTTRQVYNEFVKDIVESTSCHGRNGTVFTYGQTASGKTFTMQGCANGGSIDHSSKNAGIIQMAAHDVFQANKDQQKDQQNTNGAEICTRAVCSIRVSYMEIYNEELRDLLTHSNSGSSRGLILRDDKYGRVVVDNLKEVAVSNIEQLMQVFRVGEANKSVGSTKMNDRSSRSHAIFRITVEKKTEIDPLPEEAVNDKENKGSVNGAFVSKSESALNLVDLAGSESVRHTGASGTQKKEGGIINQSLLTLSKVLMGLGQKHPGHINYRDSKLTRILKPSLSGNARMAVICCITPSDKFIDETRSTLQFATRAKLVKTNAKKNEVIESDTTLVARLRIENECVKLENQKTEEQLQDMKFAVVEARTNALTAKKELANLRTFLFNKERLRKCSPQIQQDTDRRLTLGATATVNGDLSPNSHGNKPTLIRRHDEARFAKDDLALIFPHIDQTSRCLELSLSKDVLRAAFKFKSQQDMSLQDKSDQDERDTKLAPSKITPKESGELIAEICENPETLVQEKKVIERDFGLTSRDNDAYEIQNKILEGKLVNAIGLVGPLQRKVEELSIEKNDALDWIEEIFSKSELKEEKLKQVSKSRDDALKNSELLSNELVKTKEIFEVSLVDLERSESERDKLLQGNLENETKLLVLGNEIICIKTECNGLQKEVHSKKELIASSETREAALLCENQSEKTKVLSLLVSKAALTQQVQKLIGDYTSMETQAQDRANKFAAENNELVLQINCIKGEAAWSEAVASSKVTNQSEQLICEKNKIPCLEVKNDAEAQLHEPRDEVIHECSALENVLAKSNSKLDAALIDQEKTSGGNDNVTEEKVLVSATTELLTLKEQNEAPRSQLGEPSNTKTSNCELIKSLGCEIRRLTKKNEEGNETIKTLQEANKALVQSAERSLASARDQLTTENDCLRYQLKDLSMTVKDLGLRADEHASEVRSLASVRIKLTAENNHLLSQLNELARTIQLIEGSAKRSETVNHCLVSDIEKEREKVTKLQHEIETLAHRASERANEVRSLASARDKLATENKYLSQASHSNAELVKNSEERELEVTKLQEVNADLARKAAKKADETNLLALTRDKLTTENHSLQSQLDELSRVERDTSAERSRLEENYNNLRSENDELNRYRAIVIGVEKSKEREKANNTRLKDEKESLLNQLEEVQLKLGDSKRRAEAILVTAREEKEQVLWRISSIEAEKDISMQQLRDAHKKLSELKAAKVNAESREEELRIAVTRMKDLVENNKTDNLKYKTTIVAYQNTKASAESQIRELEGLLESAITARDAAIKERNEVKSSVRIIQDANDRYISELKTACSERDSALKVSEETNELYEKKKSKFHEDYKSFRLELQCLSLEKSELEEQILFLQAGKSSIENNADRIRERDNALIGQHERLKLKFKKQSTRLSTLSEDVENAGQKIFHLKAGNEKLLFERNLLIGENKNLAERFEELSRAKRRGIISYRTSR